MAKSGSAYKAFARHRLVAEWQETSQNIANNTSNVTIRVYLQSMDGYGAMQAPASNAGNVKANGVTKNFNATSQLSNNQKKLLTTQTFTIGHAADGKKTFSYSATFNINVTFAGTYYGNQTVSGSGTLNTIPRTSTISSISGNQIGGNVTVNISRASSSFTHRVGYYDTDGTRRNAIQDATTSTTFSIPMDRCSLLPNSTSGTAKIIVDTYSGSTRVGSTSKNHTMYVPTSVVPSLSSITFTESNATVKGMVNSSPTTMIQGHSSPLMALNGAAGTYGSTINQYKFTDVNGRETFHNGYLLGSGGPAVSGNRIIKGQVRDTRGRWSPERTLTVNILAYSPVRIVSFSTVRLASPATTIRVTKNATYSQIMGNTISYQLKYKKAGIGWTNTGNVNHATNQYDLTGYDVNTSYDLLLEVRDKLSVTTSSLSVPTEKKLLQLNADKGVGIGKPHEQGVLDVGGDVYLGRGDRILNGGGFYNGVLPSGNLSTSAYWHNPLFPQGMSLWSSIPSNGETGKPIGLDGYGLVQVFKSDTHASEVTVEYFTQPNGRIWRTGANHHVANISWTEVITNNTAIESGVLSYPAGFNSYSGDNFLRKVNGVVTIGARIRNTNQIPAGDAEITIAQLPAGYRPFHMMVSIAQGSATAVFALFIQGDGRVQLARYRKSNSSSYIPVPAGSWLNVSVSFIAG